MEAEGRVDEGEVTVVVIEEVEVLLGLWINKLELGKEEIENGLIGG